MINHGEDMVAPKNENLQVQALQSMLRFLMPDADVNVAAAQSAVDAAQKTHDAATHELETAERALANDRV